MKIAPSLITVNLMLIRDTLNQKMIGYHDNREFIDQVRSLFKSTRSLINSMDIQMAYDSDCPVEDCDDWNAMYKCCRILLDSWEDELDKFEKEWKAKVEFDKEMYVNG